MADEKDKNENADSGTSWKEDDPLSATAYSLLAPRVERVQKYHQARSKQDDVVTLKPETEDDKKDKPKEEKPKEEKPKEEADTKPPMTGKASFDPGVAPDTDVVEDLGDTELRLFLAQIFGASSSSEGSDSESELMDGFESEDGSEDDPLAELKRKPSDLLKGVIPDTKVTKISVSSGSGPQSAQSESAQSESGQMKGKASFDGGPGLQPGQSQSGQMKGKASFD